MRADRVQLPVGARCLTQGESDPLVVPKGGITRLVKSVDQQGRLAFVGKVYCVLAAQITAVAMVAFFVRMAAVKEGAPRYEKQTPYATAALLFVCIALLCCRNAVRRAPHNLVALAVLSAAMGTAVGLSCAARPSEVFGLPAGVTVAIFVSMAVFTRLTKEDFRGAGPAFFLTTWALSICSCAVIGMYIHGAIVHWPHVVAGLSAALLFSGYVLGDMQRMATGEHRTTYSVDDCYWAAICVYVDIADVLVWAVTSVGKRKP